jgi:acyl carrier protein
MPVDLIEQRLMSALRPVFPRLTREEIINATPESIGQWDSITTVTLASVIEEECGLAIDLDGELSFMDILSTLRRRRALA